MQCRAGQRIRLPDGKTTVVTCREEGGGPEHPRDVYKERGIGSDNYNCKTFMGGDIRACKSMFHRS